MAAERIRAGTPSTLDRNPCSVKKHGMWLKQHLVHAQEPRILDIGCGTGVYEDLLSPLSEFIVGIDLEKESLKKGASNDKIGFVLADAGALPFKSDSFGVLLILEVLEHVNNLDECLAEAHRVLERGGRLFITVPNRGFPFFTHGYRIGDREYSTFLGAPLPIAPYLPRFLLRRIWTARCFTASELTRALKAKGFDTEDLSFILPAFDGVLTATSRIPKGMMKRFQTLAERFDLRESSWFGSTIALVARKSA